jgi:hypothetical protein
MFEPEIFDLPSSALWSLTQALVTPTLGFLFLYLLRLPLAGLFFLPKDTKYTPPAWVLPLFAHGSTFALVAIASTNVFLNRWHEQELGDAIKPEMFLVRELNTNGKQLTNVAIVLKSYDGFSNFGIFANGYHVFSSDRDCVTSFQCTAAGAEAETEARKFKKLRASGGSVYEFNKTNSLPHKTALNHYLTPDQNYLDVISENAGTGSCELSIEVVVESENNKMERYLLSIHSDQSDVETKHQGPLIAEEDFHSGGPKYGETVERYKTPALERRNVVCEKIRISMRLTIEQALKLSSDTDFASNFLSRQKAYVCETIGKPYDDCKGKP